MYKVLHFVSNMNRGGQETLIMNLYRNINRDKIQFSFLCVSTEKGDYDEEILSMGGIIYHLPEQVSALFFPLNYLHSIRVLAKWLSNNKHLFNVVHLHTYHACDVLVHLEACRQAGIDKVVVHSHNTQGPHRILHYICRKISGLYNYKKFACGKNAGVWLFGSKPVKNGEVKIINNGINTATFKYNDTIAQKYREELGLKQKTVIGHVGRFEPQKNHELLIDIFEEYSKLDQSSVLLLVGRGSLEESIKCLVHTKGLDNKIIFLGIRDDVPALLSLMDYFVFPSLYEGLSVAAIEVQCNGLPMLTSDIPSMRESKVTDIMTFEKLSSSPRKWAERLYEISKNSERVRYAEMVRSFGYDIKDSAAKIEREYINYIES